MGLHHYYCHGSTSIRRSFGPGDAVVAVAGRQPCSRYLHPESPVLDHLFPACDRVGGWMDGWVDGCAPRSHPTDHGPYGQVGHGPTANGVRAGVALDARFLSQGVPAGSRAEETDGDHDCRGIRRNGESSLKIAFFFGGVGGEKGFSHSGRPSLAPMPDLASR